MQNMRHKKLAAMLLTLVMALSLLTVTAFAEGSEAKIGEQEYATFELAVENAKGGDTITLLQNAEVEDPVRLEKSVTLDLGGFTLSHSGDQVLELFANVTIQNGTVSMTDRASGSAIWLNGDAKLTLAADAVVSATDSPDGSPSFAIGLRPNCAGAELVVKGKVTGENGITPNGTLKTKNTISIEDGAVINVDGTALYLAGNANTTVGAAEITGDTGIEIRAGSLEVNGATITATGTFAEGPNGNGTTVTGAAIAVSQHTTNQAISVTVNSGSLFGERAFHEVDLQDDIGADKVTMNVQGGTFTGKVSSENKTGFVAGGTFTAPVDSKFIDTTKTAASLMTSDGNTTYYIGDAETVAKTLADNANAGDVITVQQGKADFTDVAAGVVVKNNGRGTVTANGQEVAPEGEVTIPAPKPEPEPEPEPEPDPEPEKPAYDKNEGKEFAKVEVGETDSSSHADDENKDNPSTGDSSNLAIAVAAMLISAGGAAAAFLSKQKKA